MASRTSRIVNARACILIKSPNAGRRLIEHLEKRQIAAREWVALEPGYFTSPDKTS